MPDPDTVFNLHQRNARYIHELKSSEFMWNQQFKEHSYFHFWDK